MLALTYIQGPQVSTWTRDIEGWIDKLNQDHTHNDLDVVWTQFLNEFCHQFQDFQQTMHVCLKLKALKLTWPDIDTYICNFESLARLASYDVNTLSCL